MPRQSTAHEMSMAFDKYANALTVLDENHRMIHDGFMFTGWARDETVAIGAKFYMLLQVPAHTFPHLQIFEVNADGAPLVYDLHEGTTFSSAGTAVTMFNRNRNSSNAAKTVVTHSPTVTDEGTVIDLHYVPSTGVGQTGIIDQSTWGEFVLAPNTNYLIGIHNDSGQARDITMNIGLYEIGPDN